MAEDMHQNGVALHAAHGMLDKDADLTQGFIVSLLFIAQLRVRVLFALARLFRRDVNLIAIVVRLDTTIASSAPNIASSQPVQLRRKLLFQHEIVVIVPTESATKKNNKLVRERHDRVLQCMLFFFPL